LFVFVCYHLPKIFHVNEVLLIFVLCCYTIVKCIWTSTVDIYKELSYANKTVVMPEDRI